MLCQKCREEIAKWLDAEPPVNPPESQSIERLLDPFEVRDILGITVNKVRKMAKNGEIPAILIGDKIRFEPSKLKKWIDAQNTTAPVEVAVDGTP